MMLSGYYFLGLGNSTEGYSILSGEGLSAAYVFPRSTSNNNQIISVNHYVNVNSYKQPIFSLPLTNGLTSGYLHPVTNYNSNIIFDVNAIYKSYIVPWSYNNNAYSTFDYSDAFVLSSTFNLYKTTNRLYETTEYGYGGDYLLENYSYFWYVRKIYEKLMVPANLIDLSIIKSQTQNIYEFSDQFHLSLNDIFMSGYLPDWYAGEMKMPISNYGANLSISSEIYSFENINNGNYYGTKPFFGLQTSSYLSQVKYYSNDVYIKNEEDKFEPALSGNNTYESLFNGFTFNETKYILSGSNKFSDLYKNQGNYFPLNYYLNNITNDKNLDYFYISKLGKFEILSGEVLNKVNTYVESNSGLIYNLGNWLSGLSYTPDWLTTINCESFNIVEAPSSEFNNYVNIIGVKTISEKTGYNSNEYTLRDVLKSIHNVENTQQIYIAIDPQSYSISL